MDEALRATTGLYMCLNTEVDGDRLLLLMKGGAVGLASDLLVRTVSRRGSDYRNFCSPLTTALLAATAVDLTVPGAAPTIEAAEDALLARLRDADFLAGLARASGATRHGLHATEYAFLEYRLDTEAARRAAEVVAAAITAAITNGYFQHTFRGGNSLTFVDFILIVEKNS